MIKHNFKNFFRYFSFLNQGNFFKTNFKTSIINLENVKKDIINGINEGKDIKKIKNEKKEINQNKIINKKDFFIEKEKLLSSKILKTVSYKEVIYIFNREKQKKPIHYSLIFFKMIQIFKNETKIRKSQLKYSQSKKADLIESIWENKDFIKICEKVKQNISEMNQESLNKVLSALALAKSNHLLYKEIFQKIIDWLENENNILLYDDIPMVKLLILLSKFYDYDSIDEIYKKKKKNILRLALQKSKNTVEKMPLSLLLKLYKVFFRNSIMDHKLIELMNRKMSHKLEKIHFKNLFLIIYSNNISNTIKNYFSLENKILDMILKKEGYKEISFKNNIQLLEILENNQYKNKDFLIDRILANLFKVYSSIILKTQKHNEKSLKLPFFNDYLKILMKYKSQNYLIIDLVKKISSLEIPININTTINLINVSINLKDIIINDDLKKIIQKNMNNFSEHIELRKINQENLITIFNVKPKIDKIIPKNNFNEIYKIFINHFIRILYKISDYNKSLIVKSIFSLPELHELFFKNIEKLVFRTEYFSFEEMEEIQLLEQNLKENPSFEFKIFNYLIFKKINDENLKKYTNMIKRQTLLIDTIWIIFNFFLLNEKYENFIEKNLILINLFSTLENFSAIKLFTLDNLDKLIDINELFKICNIKLGVKIFENLDLKTMLKKRVELRKTKFMEKNINLRKKISDKIMELKKNNWIIETNLFFNEFVGVDFKININGKIIGILIFNKRGEGDWMSLNLIKFKYLKKKGFNEIIPIDYQEKNEDFSFLNKLTEF